jgi:hypothetical protein
MQTHRPHERIELTKRVTDLLKGCLGAVPDRTKSLVTGGPVGIGLQIGVLYAILFCLLPAVFFDWQPLLFCVSVYGSLYVAWATVIARLTSAKVLEEIECRIVPALSGESIDSINNEITRRFKEAPLTLISWTVAIGGATAVGWAISRDLPHVPFLQVAWWCVGWLLLFATGARATLVARFYRIFAEHLKGEPNIYMFDPARSTLVKSVAAVGRHILLFWLGIAVSIALFVPFISLGSHATSEFPYFNWHSLLSLPTHSWFAWFLVPITTFFSIPLGTYIFLRSETAIRKAVNGVVDRTLRWTECEIADLFARRSNFSGSDLRRVHELRSLHKYLATTGSYRSFFISGLSLLLPLIGPIIPLLKVFLPGLAGDLAGGP